MLHGDGLLLLLRLAAPTRRSSNNMCHQGMGVTRHALPARNEAIQRAVSLLGTASQPMDNPHENYADQTPDVPRRRLLRRSSMTGRVTGMRRGSMASQASQISQTSVSTPGSGIGADAGNNRPTRRRTRRRNSMLSIASHDSAQSRASHNIDKLAAEIKDLQECREHELQLAEEEKRRLRLERQQSVESANMLEDLIETASMADGGFDIDAAIRRLERQQQGGSSGTLSMGDFSIPVDVMIEGDLRGEDSGKISAATFDPTDHLVAYEEPVKDEDAKHTSTTRRGRRRTSRARSPSSDEEGSVCSVEKLDYAENKIERIQQTRRSRSMSVDRVGMGAKRKPRRGRRLTRSSSRDTGGDSGTSGDGGERRIRSRSLDVGGAGYQPRHLRKRPANNNKSMRKMEVAAIADLQKQIKERKDEIEQVRNRMEMRIESAEENSNMMDEIATMQVKTIADLKVEILKTKAALRFNAVRRQDSDAIAAERKNDPEYRQALKETEESRQLLRDLRGRIDDIVQEEKQTNTKQAELLREIPRVRAEGTVADVKRTIEENRIVEHIEKEELASRIALMKSRIAKCNSNQASKDIVEGRYGTVESTENPDELQKAFVSAHGEIQQMKEVLTADVDLLESLPELKSRSSDIVRESADITLLAEDATATIELLGAEWAEQYVYLRMIRGRDEEIESHEQHVAFLNEEAKRLRRILTQKKKEAIQAKRKCIQRVGVSGCSDSKKPTSVST